MGIGKDSGRLMQITYERFRDLCNLKQRLHRCLHVATPRQKDSLRGVLDELDRRIRNCPQYESWFDRYAASTSLIG